MAESPAAAIHGAAAQGSGVSPRRMLIPLAVTQFIASFAGSNMNVAITKQLASWLFNEDSRGKTALEDSRNMKLLARVVTSRDAVALLKNGASIRNAALRTETPDALLGIALEEAASRMNVAAEQAQRLNTPPPGARQLLRSITDDAATVRTHLDKLAKSRGL